MRKLTPLSCLSVRYKATSSQVAYLSIETGKSVKKACDAASSAGISVGKYKSMHQSET